MKKLSENFLVNSGLIFLSVLFFSLAFDKKTYAFLGFFALVPFFFLLERAKNKKSAFFAGWILGTLFFLVSFRWIISLFPNETLGLDYSFYGFFLILFIWSALSLVIGLGFAIFGFVLKSLNVFSKKLSLIIIAPSIWIVSEYLRAWIFSLISWGEGALIGPYWTFGNLGYLLANTPFFYFSRIFGLYGLSFIVVMINAGIFLVIQKKYSFKYLLSVYMIIFLVISGFYFLSEYFEGNRDVFYEKNTVRVLLLGVGSKKDFFYRQSFLDLINENKINFKNQPDIVVFPEGFYLLSIFGELEKPILEKLFPDKNKEGFIVSNRASFKDGIISEIIYRNSKGEIISKQQKSFLIPGGEVLPIIIEKIMITLGLDENIKVFEKNRKVKKGLEKSRALKLGDVKVGVFLCSGVLAPDFPRQLAKDGAEVIINSASYDFFKNQPVLLHNIEIMARFQAMAYRRPFIQSTYGGSAFIIDENGKIIEKTKSDMTELLLETVYPQNKMTLISRFGDKPIILSGFFVILIFIFRIRKFQSSDPK